MAMPMPEQAPTIKGGMPLFRFRGIRVFVHWTFLILPVWVGASGYMDGLAPMAIAGRIGLVLIVFVCVILHEFGHALVAQHYGVRTRDITLLPIGGVASLERMPEEPRQEFWITVAGPLVNLVIAVLSFIAIAVLGITVMVSDMFLGATTGTKLLLFLFSANLVLFLFNLVPAFPMDGGRILRSLLSMRMAREKATRIATMVGRVFAMLFVLVGLLRADLFLALIGVFIFFAAGAEDRQVKQRAALRGVRVREVMRTRFWAMQADATVQQAIDELLAGGDHEMVVLEGDEYRGVLTRRRLVEALSNGDRTAALATLGPLPVPPIAPDTPATEAFASFSAERPPLVPVMEDGRVVGVVEPENLTEFLLVRDALEKVEG